MVHIFWERQPDWHSCCSMVNGRCLSFASLHYWDHIRPLPMFPLWGLNCLQGGSTETSHLWAGALVVWLCWDGIRRLGGSVWGYFWMFSLTPIWLQAEIAGIDLVAAVTVVQSVSHLAKSEGLKHRWHVFGWGAWMGAAFMTKYTAPMFLWAPCLVTGIWILRYQRLGSSYLGIPFLFDRCLAMVVNPLQECVWLCHGKW